MSASSSIVQPLSKRIQRIEVSATRAVAAEAERLQAAGADIVDFGAGDPHLNTPQHIKDAAIAALGANFTKYTAAGGTAELRDALVKRHALDFGSDYKPQECVAVSGGKHALFAAFQALLEHGDEVIIPVPYWTSFKDMICFSGGVPVFVRPEEKKGFELTADMVERAITPRTKIILVNSPNNPSGAVYSPEDLTAIVRMAARRNLIVISDECYGYLDYTGRPFSLGSLAQDKDRLLIVGSLSKTYSMTGWRLGFALGPEWLVSAVVKLQSQSTTHPTSIVQKAGVAALTGPQDCVQEMREEYTRLRNHITAGLRSIPGITCVEPQGAFYIYPNISAFLKEEGGRRTTAAELAGRLLREASVAVVPGEAFGTTDHVRISFPNTIANLDKGLERMRKFFAGF
jgi:aspartate aminotransferase